MNDAEFVFNETNRERKRVGWGANNKVRGGGRVVRMPSDGMSRKEKEAMNGEMKSYDLGKPMAWATFKNSPHDIQQEYLDRIVQRFNNVPQSLVAEMFKLSRGSFWTYLNNHDLSFRRGDNRKTKADVFLGTPDGEAFMRWACGEVVPVVEPVVEPIVEDAVEEPIKEPVVEKKVDVREMDINNIAVMLKALVGTGAKLTIEINL